MDSPYSVGLVDSNRKWAVGTEVIGQVSVVVMNHRYQSHYRPHRRKNYNILVDTAATEWMA